MLKYKHWKILVKNIGLRGMIGVLILTTLNLMPLIDRAWKNNPRLVMFNLIALTIILTLNLIDLGINYLTKFKINRFTKWIVLNKLIAWQTTKFKKSLYLNKHNQFLAWEKHLLSAPLWSPFIELPLGILILYLPYSLFTFTILFSQSFNINLSLVLFFVWIIFSITIFNLYFKNLNDSIKFNNKSYEKLIQEIKNINIIVDTKIFKYEHWTHGFTKYLLMIISFVFLLVGILGISIASKTSLMLINQEKLVFPSFNDWTLVIFFKTGWENALFAGVISLIIMLWGFSLLFFLHTPWPIINIWKKSFLTFNIVILNCFIISLWSIRFDTEQKNLSAIRPKEINVLEEFGQDDILATTSSIIEQINPEKNKLNPQEPEEEIVTRVIPLDMKKKES